MATAWQRTCVLGGGGGERFSRGRHQEATLLILKRRRAKLGSRSIRRGRSKVEERREGREEEERKKEVKGTERRIRGDTLGEEEEEEGRDRIRTPRRSPREWQIGGLARGDAVSHFTADVRPIRTNHLLLTLLHAVEANGETSRRCARTARVSPVAGFLFQRDSLQQRDHDPGFSFP